MLIAFNGRAPRRRALAVSLLVALASVAQCAAAHITTAPNEGVAGSYFETSLKVPHGCDGAATVAIRVTIPDGVTSVKPQMKPGWTVRIATRPVDPPLVGENGAAITSTVQSVEWRGGPLPDAFYDRFGLVMKLPATPGRTLFFPVEQTCERGSRAWTEIPAEGADPHALHSPAPFVRVTAPEPAAHVHEH
ncbi:YcnI family protein [Paraburkholderia kururiensis]|uniref:YcnI family protein n=1 Tax=Paraburkholderia kururiensis TaxID=984307 RepID=UPI0005AB103E|nr:YcnI family protein [Paraburkholderia kururiensis]